MESKRFFRELPYDDDKKSLHHVQSFRLAEHVCKCAQTLSDTALNEKLQNGDMIAQDTVYNATSAAAEKNYDDEGFTLAKAASIIWEYFFGNKFASFKLNPKITSWICELVISPLVVI